MNNQPPTQRKQQQQQQQQQRWPPLTSDLWPLALWPAAEHPKFGFKEL
jgi:hypothetical protein